MPVTDTTSLRVPAQRINLKKRRINLQKLKRVIVIY